jgi:hypothetical protein
MRDVSATSALTGVVLPGEVPGAAALVNLGGRRPQPGASQR